MLIAGGDPALESARSEIKTRVEKREGGGARKKGQSEGPERSQRMGGVAVRFLEKGVHSIGVCGRARRRRDPHSGTTGAR